VTGLQRPPSPVARAKKLARPAAALAAAGLGPGDLLANASRADLVALVAVLAAAADPGKLEAVTSQPGDALMSLEDRSAVLRRAHAERTRLDRAGLQVPPGLCELDAEYQAEVRRRRAAAAKPARPWGRVLPARLEDYARQRSRGASVTAAAGRVGVSKRTAERYEAVLVAAGKTTWREARRAA
jgi:hypothetical protein